MYGSVWLILYLLHVAYLSLGKFDYGYNMAACVMAGNKKNTLCGEDDASAASLAGTLYTVVWTVWSIKVDAIVV